MFTEIHSHRIHYEFINTTDAKDASLIVFVHEGLGSVSQWKDFPLKICQKTGLPGLVYDRYGHGRSDRLQNDRKVDYLHKEAWSELPALLEKLNVAEKVILLGHSDGASIALLFASRFPEKVKSVISIAAHVLVEDVTIQGIKETGEMYKKSLKRLLEKYHAGNTEKMFYGWMDIWTSPAFRDWNICRDISDIATPVLLLQGEQDEYATIRQISEIEASVKAISGTHIIKNCGHIPHFQQFETVFPLICDFIKQNN